MSDIDYKTDEWHLTHAWHWARVLRRVYVRIYLFRLCNASWGVFRWVRIAKIAWKSRRDPGKCATRVFRANAWTDLALHSYSLRAEEARMRKSSRELSMKSYVKLMQNHPSQILYAKLACSFGSFDILNRVKVSLTRWFSLFIRWTAVRSLAMRKAHHAHIIGLCCKTRLITCSNTLIDSQCLQCWFLLFYGSIIVK